MNINKLNGKLKEAKQKERVLKRRDEIIDRKYRLLEKYWNIKKC